MSKDSAYIRKNLVLLSTCVDDASPEDYPFILDCVLDSGALDAWLIPVIMKKGRPGVKLEILSERTLVPQVLDVVFRETTTIGIRELDVGRYELEREYFKVQRSGEDIQVKISRNPDGSINTVKPEYEDCQRIAQKTSTSLRRVRNEAITLAHDQLKTR